MSHPSNTTMNTNNGSKTIVSPSNNQALLTSTTNVVKRVVSDDVESQSKKMMIDHPAGQHNQCAVTTSLSTNFIRASHVGATIIANIKTEHEELSDDELLQMALMFEKKYPQ